MKSLIFEQFLPITIEEAWNYFSSPHNLNEITPKDINFKITSNVPSKMYEGMFITYKVAPILNIPLSWVTEITHINEPFVFIDEQRKGPYKLWHHEHHFLEVENGIIMKDILYYQVGLGVFGYLAENFFVNKKVQEIFNYRSEILKKIFNGKNI